MAISAIEQIGENKGHYFSALNINIKIGQDLLDAFNLPILHTISAGMLVR
jgi:hypothetical protein